jgi:hypothetical protein
VVKRVKREGGEEGTWLVAQWPTGTARRDGVVKRVKREGGEEGTWLVAQWPTGTARRRRRRAWAARTWPHR